MFDSRKKGRRGEKVLAYMLTSEKFDHEGKSRSLHRVGNGREGGWGASQEANKEKKKQTV